MQLLLLPLCIIVSAWSFAFGGGEDNRWNRARFAGWLDPVPEPTKPGGLGHWLKNRLTEYVKSNAERAAKAGSFVIVVLTVALAIATAL